MKHKAIILWSLLGVVGAAMLAGIIAVVLPSRYLDERVLFTIMIVGAYALGGLVVVGVGPKRMRWTMRVCSVSLAISMLVYIALVWGADMLHWRTANRIGRYTTVLLIVGIVLAHRLMIAPLRMQTTIGWIVKRGALIAAAIAGAIMCFGLITNGFYDWDDLFMRLFGVAVIVASGSSIATGAFAIFGPKAGEDEPGLLSGSIPVSLTCPRCNAAMDVQSNREGRCTGCRLKVRVEIEEPRCVCGYLLYELESGTCPECGKAVPEGDRWMSA
jgi:hypothetical protein